MKADWHVTADEAEAVLEYVVRLDGSALLSRPDAFDAARTNAAA
jgi:hypothetical protein